MKKGTAVYTYTGSHHQRPRYEKSGSIFYVQKATVCCVHRFWQEKIKVVFNDAGGNYW